MLNQKLAFFLKSLVSLALVCWLVLSIDWSQFLDSVIRSDLRLLLLVQLLMVSLVMLSAVKWRMLLGIQGIHYTLSRLHRIYYIATFFNNFLPTNIGGDAIRVLLTSRPADESGHADSPLSTEPPSAARVPVRWETAAAAVLVERLTGVVALLGVCYVGAWYCLLRGEASPRTFQVVAILGTVMLVPGCLLALGWLKLAWLAKLPSPGFAKKLLSAVLSYRGTSRPMMRVWFVSVGFQTAFVFMIYLLTRAAGTAVDLAPMFVIVPLQSLVLLIPVTINGIGLSEAGYVVLFSAINVPAEEALAVAILVRLLLVPLSIVGGFIYLAEPVSALKGMSRG